MPEVRSVAYDAKAQDFAYSFYARGWSKARALPKIREVYAGFSGSTWDEWEAKFGWRERRAAAEVKRIEFETLLNDTARVLLVELDEVRKPLYDKVRTGTADTQTVYAYTSIVKQIADITRQQLAMRDGDRVAMETLTRAFDGLFAKLREISDLGAALERNAEAVGAAVAQVAESFGREKGGAS
jgi:hypothetical protein